MCLISSAGRLMPSSATTGASLTTLPPGSSSCRMAHSSRCRAHTHQRRMAKLNISFVPLTMSSTLCLSRLPFPDVIGLKDCTQLHTSWTVFQQRLFRLRVRTLPLSGLRPHMRISEFSAARVTLTLLQLHLISSLLALPGVSCLATPLITKATAALISPQTA
jgi:hypothetical protein